MTGASKALCSMLAAIMVVATACSDDFRIEGDTTPYVASASCPLKSRHDWQVFLDRTTDDERWVKTCAFNADCEESFGDFNDEVRTNVLGIFDRCSSDLADNPDIARCTARLRQFIPAWTNQHASNTYGFSSDNAAYFAAQIESDEPPTMMDPPAAILAALPERARIEETAAENGWPYLTHDSFFGGLRTFILVTDPENRFDQWFLVSLDPDGTLVTKNPVMSFIAVQKKDASGRDLDRMRVHFRDYLMGQVAGTWQLALPELHEGKCFACHLTGTRQLLPTHGSVVVSAPVSGEPGFGQSPVPADFGFTRLSELNQRLLSYGVPDWNGAIDPADAGPALGGSLGCTVCHNGEIRGPLSVLTDERSIESKMVDELDMRSYAPGVPVPDETAIALLDREITGTPPLTVDEVGALDEARAQHIADYESFVADRFPAWRTWVLEQPCE